MYSLPDIFYDVNLLSTAIRLFLAVLFGGIIGLERGVNRHPAGFRTHILVCAGAALVMLTNQYICEAFHTGDPARLGAQVITGVGFLGAGTILVVGRNKIKGLTTAAGLWASACLGLALGIGFYSGAVIAAILIFTALALLPKVEDYFYRHASTVYLYIEIDSIDHFREFVKYIHTLNAKFYETQIIPGGGSIPNSVGFQLYLDLGKAKNLQEIENSIQNFDGVYLVEEL